MSRLGPKVHVLAVLMATMPAMADESRPVLLTWSGPGDCPSGERVVARVEQLLSRAKRVGMPLVAEATIAAEGDGYRLDLSTEHGEKRLRRTVHAEACEELADAAALILALWIDPSLLTEQNQMAEQNRSEGAAEPATRPSGPTRAVSEQNRIAEQNRSEGAAEPTTRPSAPTRAPHRADPSARRLHWRVNAGPVVDFGSLPTLAPGLEMGGGVEVGRLAATLSSQWFPYSRRQIADEPPKGGTFSLLTAMGRVCYQPLERFALAGCAGAELGVLRAEGYGTALDDERSIFWASAGPGFEVLLPVSGKVSVRGAGDVLFALQRPNFLLQNVGSESVYEPEAASLRLAVGLLLRFP
jgi:hypothetical protein